MDGSTAAAGGNKGLRRLSEFIRFCWDEATPRIWSLWILNGILQVANTAFYHMSCLALMLGAAFGIELLDTFGITLTGPTLIAFAITCQIAGLIAYYFGSRDGEYLDRWRETTRDFPSLYDFRKKETPTSSASHTSMSDPDR